MLCKTATKSFLKQRVTVCSPPIHRVSTMILRLKLQTAAHCRSHGSATSSRTHPARPAEKYFQSHWTHQWPRSTGGGAGCWEKECHMESSQAALWPACRNQGQYSELPVDCCRKLWIQTQEVGLSTESHHFPVNCPVSSEALGWMCVAALSQPYNVWLVGGFKPVL